MQRYSALIVLALALTSCRTDLNPAGPGFSFSERNLPSLMDINNRKFVTPLGKDVYRLTNVDPSFDRSYVLIHDEAQNIYLIQDKQGRTLFEGHFDGIPRYAACVDIDADHDQDVIVELAAYGNHGNGTESFELLLNERGKLTHLRNPICEEFNSGQENRAGLLTWYSSPKFCAIFIGEEASVTGVGTEADPIKVSDIRKVRELWGHKNGELRLISKSSTPITVKDVKYLTFR